MKGEEAGGLRDHRKAGKNGVCGHQRMVDEHCNEHGEKTGRLVCRECGAVLQDSMKA